MASRRILHKTKSPEFCVIEQAVRMRRATLFKLSRRIVINRTINTIIVNTTVMLNYVLPQRGTDAACLNRHLVTLHVQTLPHMELSTTIRGTSTSTSE